MRKTLKRRDNLRVLEKIAKKKKKLICYICGKEEHKSYQCNQRKGRPNQGPVPQAKLAKQDDKVKAAVVEVNLIENKID